MGKGKRLRSGSPSSRPQRAIVVVDDLEVGQQYGMMTWRMGRQDRPPLNAALPCEATDDFLAKLHEASLHAEESYWDLLAWLRTQVPTPDDNEAFARAKERWLLSRDWKTSVSVALAGENLPLFLVSNFAHVGVVLGPPFTAKPSLAVLDPLQIRRLKPSFTDATAHGRREIAANAPTPVGHRAAMALRFLDAQPWPVQGFIPPSRAEADHEAHSRHRAFLARSPYLLPEENTAAGVRKNAAQSSPLADE
ncbi:hypothetical protein [Streptomyces sp. NPDC006552]|uniref:hypothetical protein n=1 Tax=Streptomyces sp. NPDC006552 TaxID=3157179 RepID=UPI0033A145DB